MVTQNLAGDRKRLFCIIFLRVMRKETAGDNERKK